MVSEPNLVFPKDCVELLKEDFKGTFLEGITDEIKKESNIKYRNILTDYDLTGLFDLTDSIDVGLLKGIQESEEMDFSDWYYYTQLLFEKIAFRIDENFDSDEDLAEYIDENEFKCILTNKVMRSLTDWYESNGDSVKVLLNVHESLDVPFADALYIRSRMAGSSVDKLYWGDEPSEEDYFMYKYTFVSEDDDRSGNTYQVVGQLTEKTVEEFEMSEEIQIENSAFQYKIVEYDEEIDELPTEIGVMEGAGDMLVTCDDEHMFEFTSKEPDI